MTILQRRRLLGDFIKEQIMPRHWTDTEYQILGDLIGRYPFPEVPKRFQAIAKKQNLLPRTTTAIAVKAKRQYVSVKAIDSNFPYHSLAKMLGINKFRVREWVRAGKLKVQKVKNSPLTKVSPKAFKAFAAKYPHLLSDSNFDALAYFLGEETAKQITDLPSSKSQPKPVKNLETGETYPSIQAAAKATFYNKGAIRNRVKKGEWVQLTTI